jgi:glycerophosphoryl diester phosphodiesterase
MVCGTGEVVVCHDERLHRLAGLDWEVRRAPLGKLQRADVGTPLGFAPAFIPTLEEVLQALPPHFIVNIELKCARLDDDGLSVKVGNLVERLGIAERVVVSSFNPTCLFRLASSHPFLKRGVLMDPDRSFHLQDWVMVPLLANHSVHPFHTECTPSRVRRWREQGWEIAAWTVNAAATACQLRDLGVRYCITDHPAKVKVALTR